MLSPVVSVTVPELPPVSFLYRYSCNTGRCHSSHHQAAGSSVDDDVGAESHGNANPSRRGLLTTSLAAALVAAEANGATKHMARALVLTGQEKEEGKMASNDVARLQSRISTFSLANGMRWIVLERHNAPVVACHTYASVGAALEADGCTGVAHLLEHLAFKGTKLVGTRDAAQEVALLNQLDEAFYSLRDAKLEGNSNKSRFLERKFKELQEEAAALVVPNEYGALIAREGGVGLNAQTSQDDTEYFVSLPANKLELWMALESGRFLAPVFRELYSEKEVIKEERRLRVDNTSYGSFTEAFTELAFPRFPYRRPVIGYPDDFERIGRREVSRFFSENYNPKTLTCAVVGDVDPLEVERLAERYFGGWVFHGDNLKAKGDEPINWHKEDGWDKLNRTKSQRFLSMKLPAQPFYMEGYYRPPSSSTDDPVISIIDELLSGGRLSRFYKNIILEGRALSVTSIDTFPGDQRPCLFLLYGVPPAGAEADSLAETLHQELDLLKSSVLKEEEISRIKKAARASLLELFGSNRGMAKLLCKYEATTGTCSNLFKENELMEHVTPAEVCRVASLLFHPDNCIRGSVTSSFE